MTRLAEKEVGQLFYFTKRVCQSMPEYRLVSGHLEYPVGLLALSVFLAECAGCFAQMSKAIWLKNNFRWICRLWRRCGGSVQTKKSPSQSTLSRLVSNVDVETFSRLVSMLEISSFEPEWLAYKKSYKAEIQRKRKLRQKSKRSKIKERKASASSTNFVILDELESKPFPQYCFDGKARSGCVSSETGRTMIDVTMYCPETKQILATRTLQDKQGEPKAVIDILENEARSLPEGIISGDAGILSPNVTQAITTSGHSYLLQIKANAGQAYNEVIDMPWNDVQVVDKHFSEGHGRREIRFLKRLEENYVDFDELNKYAHCDAVWKRETWVSHDREERYSSYERYLVGGGKTSTLPDSMIQRYARDHWKQESYHWVKDVVLQEDASHQKQPNGSQFLGVIRSQVVRAGTLLFGSTKRFRDHFMTSPEKIAKDM